MDTGLIGQPRLPRRETYLDGTPESSVPGLEQPPGNHDQEIVKRLEAGNVNQGLAAQFRLQHGSHESRFSTAAGAKQKQGFPVRSEEHTSELQSLRHLVCRLLLEKKNCRRTCSPGRVAYLLCGAPGCTRLHRVPAHNNSVRRIALILVFFLKRCAAPGLPPFPLGPPSPD